MLHCLYTKHAKYGALVDCDCLHKVCQCWVYWHQFQVVAHMSPMLPDTDTLHCVDQWSRHWPDMIAMLMISSVQLSRIRRLQCHYPGQLIADNSYHFSVTRPPHYSNQRRSNNGEMQTLTDSIITFNQDWHSDLTSWNKRQLSSD